MNPKHSIHTIFFSLIILLASPLSEALAQSNMSIDETIAYILKHGGQFRWFENKIEIKKDGTILFTELEYFKSEHATTKWTREVHFNYLDAARVKYRVMPGYSGMADYIAIIVPVKNNERKISGKMMDYHEGDQRWYPSDEFTASEIEFGYDGVDEDLAKIMVKAFKHLITLVQAGPNYDDPF